MATVAAANAMEHKARRYQQMAALERELSLKSSEIGGCKLHMKELQSEWDGILSKLRASARDEGDLPLLDMMDDFATATAKAN